MSPGKMANSYLMYVERCNGQYLDELNMREKCKVELSSIYWVLDELDATQKTIRDIQEADCFIRWATDNDVNHVSEILKL
jgi:hypothetical protein